MPQEARNPAPTGKDTGPARQRAYRALQRRLRHAVGRVEWRDAIAGALLGQLLDALGGEELGGVVKTLLGLLLD